MREWWEKIILDNTVLQWLIVAAIITAAFLFQNFFSRQIARIIHRAFTKKTSSQNLAIFLKRGLRPLKMLFLAIVIESALTTLNFPSVLNIRVFGFAMSDILPRIGLMLILIFIIWLIVSILNITAVAVRNAHDSGGHSKIVFFFRDLIKVIVVISGIMLILQYVFDRDIRALLQGLTIIGAAVALAAKESLENLIASFIIFFDKPFFIDDVVTVSNTTGTVERIGLRSTRLRTADKTLVTIPNKQMVDNFVNNLSMITQRRGVLNIELSSDTPADKIQEFIAGLKATLQKHPDQVNSSSVNLTDFTKDSAKVQAEYYTIPFKLAEFNALKQELNLEVMKQMEALGLKFSGNATNIIVSQPQGEVKKDQSII